MGGGQSFLWFRGGLALIAANTFGIGAMGPAPVSAMAGNQQAVGRFDACLRTAKGSADDRIAKCIDVEVDPSDEWNACASRPAAQRAELESVRCYEVELDRTYFRMKHAYSALLQRLPPQQANALRSDQKAWLARRQKVCAPADLREDYLMCLMAMNNQRIEQLDHRAASLRSRPRR